MSALISVIVPAYNAAGWVGETLASICRQTYDHARLEVILVDDGSTDETAAVAAHVLGQSGLAHQITRLPNGGPSRARNAGAAIARGTWLQFLDADDLLATTKIATQARATPDLDERVAVVYSNWQRLARVAGRWQATPPVVNPRIGDDPLRDILHTDNFLQVGSVLIRRSWLERVGGFDERHWLIEDVDLLLRLAIRGGQFHKTGTAEPLLFYRQHDGASLSRRDQRAFTEGCLRNVRMVEAHWRAGGELSADRAAFLAEAYFQGARYFATVDEGIFEELVRTCEALVARFLPPGPAHLRFVSRLVGYRRAERIAIRYRRLRHGPPRGA